MEKRITDFFSKIASKQPRTWKNHLISHQSRKDHVLPFPRPFVHPQKKLGNTRLKRGWGRETCHSVRQNSQEMGERL